MAKELQSNTVTRDPKTLEYTKNLRIIDDALFRLIAPRKGVCQEILRTLLDDDKLEVIEVSVQETLVSIYREIILDALCLLGDGTYCNIEMQKGNQNDDVRRVRFHASSITVNRTEKGADFTNVPNVKVVYITEYDALNNNQSTTEVVRCQKKGEKYEPVNDGESILFANTVVEDQTKHGKLLKRFLEKDSFRDPEFPELSKAIEYFKSTEEGDDEMYRGIGYIQEQTREEERKNTEREKARADAMEKRADAQEKRADDLEKQLAAVNAEKAEMEKRIKELESKNN